MAAVEAMPMAACDQQLETVMLLEPRPFRPFKSSEEYLYAMKEDLADWLNHLYGLSITVDDFMEKLETGVVLCQHANHVRQLALEHHRAGRNGFSVPIPHREVVYRQEVAAGTFHARDNVSNFIAWCRSLGIYECLLFETDDLVLRKNEKSFILCLLEVARRGAKFGMPAPLLVQMEEEIDREIAKENEKTKNGTSGDDYEDADNGLDPPIQIITNDLKSLDEMVRDLVNRCTCPVQFPMIRVSEGKYRIGDTQMLIFVRILRSHVMVRVGGGWDTLEHYLDKHDPCRCRLGHRTTVSSKLMVKHSSPYNFANPQMQVTYERSPEPFRVGGTTSSPQSGGSGNKTSLSTPGSPQRVRRASNSSNPSLASKSSTGSLASTGSDKEQKQSSTETTKAPRPNSDTYLSTATFLPTDGKSSGLHVTRYYFGGGDGTPVSTGTDRTLSTTDLTMDEGYQSGSKGQPTPNLKAPRKILGGTAEDVSGERPDSRLTVGSSDCGSLEDPSLHKRDSLLDSPDSPVGVLEEEESIPNDGRNLNHNNNSNVSNHVEQTPPPIGSAIPKRSKIPFLDSSASLRPSARKKSQSSENLGGVELLAAMQAEALGMNPATVVKTRHLSGERVESPGRSPATKQPHVTQSSSMTRSRSQGGETGNDMAAYMSRNTLGRYSYRNPRPDPSPATRIPKTGVNRTWACRTRDARPSLSPDLFSRPPPARHTPNKSPSPQRRSLPTGGSATPKGSPTRGANSSVHAGGPSRSLQSSPSRQQGPPLLQEVLTVAEDLSTDEQLIRKMEEILQQYKNRVEQNNRCSKGEDEVDETQPIPRKSLTPTQSPRHRRRVSPSPIAILPPNEDGDNYTKHWVATTANRHRQRRASSASLGSPDSSSEAGDDAAAAAIRGGWSRENSNLGANGNGGRSSRGSSRCTSPVPSLSGASIVTVGGSRIPVRVSPRRDSAPGGPTKIPVPTYYAS